jgi:hypothetical protein
MNQPSRFIFTVALLVILPMAGCIVPPAGVPGSSGTSSAGTADLANQETSAVPEDLIVIEEQAEDIFDFAPRNDWARISEDITKVQTAWNAWQQQASNSNANSAPQDALRRALARLETAATQHEQAATLQAANDLSAAVIDLFDLYQPTIPTDIGRLDVLGRQITLDVAAGDWTKAEETLTSTQAVWAQIKPSVLAHAGADAATQYETSLQQQAELLSAKAAVQLIAEANHGLELVDALERLY